MSGQLGLQGGNELLCSGHENLQDALLQDGGWPALSTEGVGPVAAPRLRQSVNRHVGGVLNIS